MVLLPPPLLAAGGAAAAPGPGSQAPTPGFDLDSGSIVAGDVLAGSSFLPATITPGLGGAVPAPLSAIVDRNPDIIIARVGAISISPRGSSAFIGAEHAAGTANIASTDSFLNDNHTANSVALAAVDVAKRAGRLPASLPISAAATNGSVSDQIGPMAGSDIDAFPILLVTKDAAGGILTAIATVRLPMTVPVNLDDGLNPILTLPSRAPTSLGGLINRVFRMLMALDAQWLLALSVAVLGIALFVFSLRIGKP